MVPQTAKNVVFNDAPDNRISHIPSQKPRADVFRHGIDETKKVCHKGRLSRPRTATILGTLQSVNANIGVWR